MLKILSIFGYACMVAGVGSLLYMHMLFSPALPVITVQITAALLMVWARVTFGLRSFHLVANPTRGELVTTGPYRYIRHPIYTAFCLFTVASLITHISYISIALCSLVIIGALVRLRCEEIMLRERFPQYSDYATKTWRMIPYIF